MVYWTILKLIMKKALIIGDGLIGTELAQSLRNSGIEVFITSRHVEKINSKSIFLDLEKKTEEWPVFPSVDIVFFCAAETSTKKCEEYPERTAITNVNACVTLAEFFSQNHVFFIFISTNQVFDGKRHLASINDEVSPVTMYGKQKAKAEKSILSFENTAIIRLSKIVQSNSTLFESWINS